MNFRKMKKEKRMKVTYTRDGERATFENLNIRLKRSRATSHFYDEGNTYYCYEDEALIIENEEKMECKILDSDLTPGFVVKKGELILIFEGDSIGPVFSVAFKNITEIYEFAKKIEGKLNQFTNFFEILKNLTDDGIAVHFTFDPDAIVELGREKNIYVNDNFCYVQYHFCTKCDDVEIANYEKSPEENLKILRRFLRSDYLLLEKEKN